MSTRVVAPIVVVAAAVGISAAALTERVLNAAARQSLAPIACSIAPDKDVPIVTGPGRKVFCGLDLGSRTAKLSVVSMVPRSRATVRDERLCRRTLGFGAQVFDASTKTAKALPPTSIENLSATINEFRTIC